MENIKTCELCLEQIIKSEDFENLHCDEDQNLKILKNLAITVSRDAKICSNCVNVAHVTYNFKTSCLSNNDHLKTLIVPGNKDKLILEEVIVKEIKSELKNEKVCRLCLNFSEVNSLVEINLEQDVILRDMLGRCLPEIDTNIVQNPLICYICSELLEKLFNFISHCEDTEVLRKLDTKTDILVNQNMSTVTAKNNDDNIDDSFVKEENCEGLEDPELQIKSEDIDIDEHSKDSINDSNCLLKEGEIHSKPSTFSSRLTHQRKTRKSTRNKLYKCTECLLQFQCKRNLVRHKRNIRKTYKCNLCSFTGINNCEIVKHKKKVHQNLAGSGLFKCHKCPYITKWKRGLHFHNIRWHEDPLKLPKYKCDQCPYETLWRHVLVTHKVTHKNPSEVKMYKCTKCSLKTKYKGSLLRHEKMHEKNGQSPVKIEQSLKNSVEEKDMKPEPPDTTKGNKLVCDICLLQTTTKYSLKRHHLTHKEPSDVNVFKCDYCPFSTKWKNSLSAHAIRHKNPSEVPKFKCNHCPYETNTGSNLARHVLVHKDPSEVNMYKCKVCSYQTKSRRYLQVHQKKHQVEIYTCDECNYKTKLKKSFVVHLQYHEELKQSTKSNKNLKKVRLYKCNECYYVGKQHSHLIRHQMIHKDPSEREMYNCTECSFQALYKITLQRHHKKNHSDLEVPFGEIKSFRCTECDYETTHRNCILKHLQTHKQEKMMPNVKEELQEQDSMHNIKEGT